MFAFHITGSALLIQPGLIEGAGIVLRLLFDGHEVIFSQDALPIKPPLARPRFSVQDEFVALSTASTCRESKPVVRCARGSLFGVRGGRSPFPKAAASRRAP
jgi:hypothetical protein